MSLILPETQQTQNDMVEMEQAQSANRGTIAINTGTVKVSATLYVEYQID